MKNPTLALAALISVVTFSGAAIAEDTSTLARAKGCLACHGIDKKIVGPSFKDVAAKYKGDAAAAGALAAKLKTGGKGVWGPIPMPPNPALSDDDTSKLVSWVLAQ